MSTIADEVSAGEADDARPARRADRRLPAGLPPLPRARPAQSWRWPAPAVLLAAAVAPLVWMLATVLIGGGPRTESADDALLTLAARDAMQHGVLIGPYSRFGWHHPGPTYLYLLGLPTRLWGGGPTGSWVGAISLVIVSVGASVLVMRRWAGNRAGWWTAAGVLFVLAGVRPWVFRDPWNPYAVAFPVLFVIIASALAAAGSPGLLAWAAVAASLAVQTHVSTVPVVVAPLAIAACAQALRWYRGRRSNVGAHVAGGRHHIPAGLPSIGTPAIETTWWMEHPASAVALLVLLNEWLPPLWDEFFGTGNLSSIISFFLKPHPTHGWDQSWRIAVSMFGIVMTQHHDGIRDGVADPHPLLITIGFVALAAVAAIAGVRAKRPAAVWLGAFGVLGAAIGIYSITRIVDEPYRYLLVWMTVLPVVPFAGAAIGIEGLLGDRGAPPDTVPDSLDARPDSPVDARSDSPVDARPDRPDALPDPDDRLERPVLDRMWLRGAALAHPENFVVAVAFALASVLALRGVASAVPASKLTDPDVVKVTALADGVLKTAPGPVLIELADGERWPTSAGLGLELEREGHPVHVQKPWTLLFGANRATTGIEPTVLVIGGVDPGSWPPPYQATFLGAANRTHLFVRREGPACWWGWVPFGGPACPFPIAPLTFGPRSGPAPRR